MFKKSILASLFSIMSLSAIASGFSVSPLLVDLQTKGTKRITSFEVNNDDDQALKMEITASLWNQDGDKEVYKDDVSDLTFFPRVFTIAPHSKQVVRLSYKGESNLKADKAYRLWFSEIQSQSNNSNQDSSSELGAVVSLSYRIGAGVFVKQEGKPVETLTSSIEKSNDGNFLKIKNTGNTHLYPSETTFKLKTNSGDIEVQGPPTWHIQPGVERTFKLNNFDCSNISSAKLIIDGEKKRTIETSVNCK
jgi:P pilus assembly chaperone PapD